MTAPIHAPQVTESTVEALRRGDPQAFAELYRLLHARVYNLAARIVGDRGEAEDITQEVFLRAFRHLPGITGPLRPEPWVFRTTVNACYDHLRRRRPVPAEFDAARDAAAGDSFDQAATVIAVEKSLAALNPRYRTALVLKDIHGMDNDEVAEAMGVTRGTAAVLLFRARGTFAKHYRELAPTVGASVPVAGLMAGLPMLPVPASLRTPPAFVPNLTGPLSSTALAPLAESAVPAAEGIGRLTDAVAAKIAILLIAATAVVGGGVAAHDVGDDVARPPAAFRSVASAPDASSSDLWQASAPSSKFVRGDPTREPVVDEGDKLDATDGARVEDEGDIGARIGADAVTGNYLSPGPGSSASAPTASGTGPATGTSQGGRDTRDGRGQATRPPTAAEGDARTPANAPVQRVSTREAPAAEV